jgi:hypothetical protein
MRLQLKRIFASTTIMLALMSATAGSAYAQHSTFLDQLRKIFGRFRDSDLRQVFDTAKPVVCSDLVSGSGEWREVAFFNEYRPFGDWHRTSLDEVRRDLAAYVFQGTCTGWDSAVHVTTQFPVEESIKAYEDRKIHRRDIAIHVNAPVRASFDSQTGAYTFDLPYLFRISDRDTVPLYALNARTPSDRYATDVTNRWECKLIADNELTYQFLICHTRLVFNDSESENHGSALFGTSAFSVLSDGREASSSVKLTFGEAPQFN